MQSTVYGYPTVVPLLGFRLVFDKQDYGHESENGRRILSGTVRLSTLLAMLQIGSFRFLW